MPDLWDRQRLGPDGQFVDEGGELEPVLWYGRFRDYIVLGPERSLVTLADNWRASRGVEKTGWVPGAWYNACKKWRWPERAQAWDAEQLRLRWAEDRERYNRMIRRHGDLGRGMQTAAARGLQHISRKAEEDPDSLTASEAVRLAEAGIKAERTAEGLPTELIGIVAQLSRMTDDELRDYVSRLADSAGTGLDGGETPRDEPTDDQE